jgi:uncharacterized protein YprB with RNaseH-like and TPR domain
MGEKKQKKRLSSELDRLVESASKQRKGAQAETPSAPSSLEQLRRDLRRKTRQKSKTSGPPPVPINREEPADYENLIVYRRDLPRNSPSSRFLAENAAEKIALEEVVESEEIDLLDHGKSLLVANPVDEAEKENTVSGRFFRVLRDPESLIFRRIFEVCEMESIEASDIIFTDIETTGLANTPLFLIGTMIWGNGGFEVRQHFARNYAEEGAVISHFLSTCASRKLLVTFNGKSFDIPYIRTRAAANGIAYDLDPWHFDLLHESRRRWKGFFPDYRLQTLERHICKRLRHGDIPGSEIPDAYHAYVRTENAWQIVEVLKHNMLDLITLADLMSRFG